MEYLLKTMSSAHLRLADRPILRAVPVVWCPKLFEVNSGSLRHFSCGVFFFSSFKPSRRIDTNWLEAAGPAGKLSSSALDGAYVQA
jgi:hypothetical protein